MISISNIAWDPSIDDRISKILIKTGVAYVDIAPSKYFPTPSKATSAEILTIKNYWIEKNIKPLGMQSLLFGTQGLNVFGTPKIQDALLLHLSDIIFIGSELGARKLVFGSPKNRDRSNLSDSKVTKIAVDFFSRLGRLAEKRGVVICLEPNPECYGSNFMTNSIETAEIVEATNCDSIRMQLDTGAMKINKEGPRETIKKYAHLIHHIHISEPYLVPVISKNHYHQEISESIVEFLPNLPMTIEMLSSSPAMAEEEILNSIKTIKELYRVA